MTAYPVNLAITALGLTTSVGRDAHTVCAAIRAGISRAAPADDFGVPDLAEQEETPLVGHPVRPVTDGFQGLARWLQLAPLAFEDLLRNGALPGREDEAFWAGTGLAVLLPRLSEDRFAEDPRMTEAAISATFLDPLLRLLPTPLSPAHAFTRALGRAGLAAVLAETPQTMQQLRLERLIVLAVDSYLDLPSLHWLDGDARLKTDVNPVGMMPGEAASAILLESPRRTERRVLARVTAVGLARETDADTNAPRGRALAQTLAETLGTHTAELYVDLNGEQWRAKEYGHALLHLGEEGIRGAELRYPAGEVGDTGTASAILAAALAARSIERGYALGNRIVVASSNRSGELGAFALERPR